MSTFCSDKGVALKRSKIVWQTTVSAVSNHSICLASPSAYSLLSTVQRLGFEPATFQQKGNKRIVELHGADQINVDFLQWQRCRIKTLQNSMTDNCQRSFQPLHLLGQSVSLQSCVRTLFCVSACVGCNFQDFSIVSQRWSCCVCSGAPASIWQRFDKQAMRRQGIRQHLPAVSRRREESVQRL